jgi:two-component system chemotaxis sensor kinase CheA
MEDLLKEFLTETYENLDVVDVELVRFEAEPDNAEILGNIFRLVHTIKGTCGFLGLPRLEKLAHAAEGLMGRFRDGMPVTGGSVSLVLAAIDRIKLILAELERARSEPPGTDDDLIRKIERVTASVPAAAERAVGTLVEQSLERPLMPDEVPLDELERAFREAPGPDSSEERRKGNDRRTGDEREGDIKVQTIRVQVETLEQLMTLVSELVLTRNQLLDLVRRHQNSEFQAPLQRLSSVTADLQESVMKTRMQPIGTAWAKLPRLVRDLSAELGKQIRVERAGTDTELDRQVLELIKDPLTHMVRNSCDHGIEPPEERRAAGKPEVGTIRLSAFHEGGQVVIQIADDGRGLDPAGIAARAVRLGLVSEADVKALSEAQVLKFIFAPGFSTAAAVTSVSGRGVGMDVVKRNIDQIGGTVELTSQPGRGATFTIKIPLTLAIISALIVEAAGSRFAVPQVAVVELVRLGASAEHRVERIHDSPVLQLRERLVPLVHLKSVLRLGEDKLEQDNGFIVVMQVGRQSFGLVVGDVFHTEEIVVKPMSALLRDIPVFSGNTILGDGSVIMILDPNGLAATVGSQLVAADDVTAAPAAAAKADDPRRRLSLLVFRAGTREPKAVPLSLVTRLEEVDAGAIEFSGGRHVVQYRGGLMPLVPVNDETKVRSQGKQPLVVFTDGSCTMGLVVDEIIDIFDDRLEIHAASDVPGVLGSAIVRGRATEIIDLAHYLPQAHEDWLRRKPTGPGPRRRVLLVDDSAFFRDMLAPVLQSAGCDVTSAAGADDAFDRIEAGERFDVVISDLDMPDTDGFRFAERLRADPRTAGSHLIALVSQLAVAAVERGRAAGFDQFVAKFDRRGLLAALSSFGAANARAA